MLPSQFLFFFIVCKCNELFNSFLLVGKLLHLVPFECIFRPIKQANRNAIKSSKHISQSVFILMHGFSKVLILRNDMILCVYDNTITKVITCFNPFIQSNHSIRDMFETGKLTQYELRCVLRLA